MAPVLDPEEVADVLAQAPYSTPTRPATVSIPGGLGEDSSQRMLDMKNVGDDRGGEDESYVNRRLEAPEEDGTFGDLEYLKVQVLSDVDSPPSGHDFMPMWDTPVLDGPLPPPPSIGSMAHAIGSCKPCAFFHTKGCENGSACLFCHLCGVGEKKKRRKGWKELRHAYAALAQQGQSRKANEVWAPGALLAAAAQEPVLLSTSTCAAELGEAGQSIGVPHLMNGSPGAGAGATGVAQAMLPPQLGGFLPPPLGLLPPPLGLSPPPGVLDSSVLQAWWHTLSQCPSPMQQLWEPEVWGSEFQPEMQPQAFQFDSPETDSTESPSAYERLLSLVASGQLYEAAPKSQLDSPSTDSGERSSTQELSEGGGAAPPEGFYGASDMIATTPAKVHRPSRAGHFPWPAAAADAEGENRPPGGRRPRRGHRSPEKAKATRSNAAQHRRAAAGDSNGENRPPRSGAGTTRSPEQSKANFNFAGPQGRQSAPSFQ